MSKARDIADLDFNAPDIDGGNIDGAVIGGTTPAASTFTDVVAASLDISGDIDVDGTTNLDVVDIDGAVDMASTLVVGSTLSSGDITIAVDDTPTLNFKKASTADVLASINVTTDAGSGGKLVIQTKRNGNTPVDRLTIDDDGAATFNSTVTSTAFGSQLATTLFEQNVLKSSVASSAGAFIRMAVSGAGNPTYAFEDDTNTGMFTSGADTLNFATAGTEHARLDSAGRFIVGALSAFDSSSFCVDQSGLGQFRRDGTPLIVRRDGGDGGLIDFEKDGASAGSIGGGNSWLAIGSGTGNVYFDDGLMAPVGSVGGASSNGVVDLGTTARRFKDLYLSGGVYLGGTGAANKLDDYETGTWTPVIKAIGTGGNNATYTLHGPTYTKVGRLVNVQVYISGININAITAGSYITLQGFPFACTNYADFTIAYKSGSWSTVGNIIGGYLQTGTSYAYFMRANGVEAQQTSTDVTMTKAMINITYQAS